MGKTATTLSLLAAVAVAGHAYAQSPPNSSVARDFVAPGPSEPLPSTLAAALGGVQESALAAHVAFLASPGLAGRGLGSRGLDAALEYAAAALALAGVPPLQGEESGGTEHSRYFQPVPLREIRGVTGRLTIERRQGEERWSRTFQAGMDCLLPDVAPQSLAGPVVFAGYGIQEPRLGHDDYRGLDVRGRIVLVLGGLPPGDAWRAPELLRRYDAKDEDERFAVKLAAAREAGASAVLAVDPGRWSPPASQSPDARPPVFLPVDAARRGDGPLLFRISPAVAAAILGGARSPGPGPATTHPGDLAGVRASIEITGDERVIVSRNALGAIVGSDPQMRDQAVILGAHLDHLGEVGDVVYPGADDNASGVAALLEIAKAFAGLPGGAQRTVVFAFWTGEEEGKLGSGHFVRYPLWPLTRTVAYLNLDMIGHPWALDEIRKLVSDSGLPGGEAYVAGMKPPDFVEPGLPPDAPELEAALRQAAHGTGLALHLDRTDGTHGGSDYRDFARAHVPFIRFFGNFFPGYHEPGDTAESLDAGQVQRVARLALATAWLLANPASAPSTRGPAARPPNTR
ncbi:MAG: M20/M25/M40 family metallo-hydrolase [Acidobacteriota bacterium]